MLHTCAGVFNQIQGNKKREVKIYSTYCTPLSISSFKIGDYGILPAIISKECSGKGDFRGKDGGWVCLGCKKLRVARGNSNPDPKLMNWFYKVGRAIERSSKQELTSLDIVEAENFSIINVKYLNVEHVFLIEQAKA